MIGFIISQILYSKFVQNIYKAIRAIKQYFFIPNFLPLKTEPVK
jgi:hypothetical protein